MELRPFSPQDIVEMTGDPSLEDWASICMMAGPSASIYHQGHIIASGGLRMAGVGEAWFVGADNIRVQAKTLLKMAREQLDTWHKAEKAWRIFAYADPRIESAQTFLKHLNFKRDALVLGGE